MSHRAHLRRRAMLFALALVAWLPFVALHARPAAATPTASHAAYSYDRSSGHAAGYAALRQDLTRPAAASPTGGGERCADRSVGTASRIAAEEAGGGARSLFHYTTEEGQKGILDSGRLNPSLKSVNPSDARYGNGQYLTYIAPGAKTGPQLSRALVGNPFQGARFSHYLEIDVSGLDVVEGRAGVFVVPGEEPLDLLGRILGYGANG